jgi:hypothetical protein
MLETYLIMTGVLQARSCHVFAMVLQNQLFVCLFLIALILRNNLALTNHGLATKKEDI